MSDLRKRMAALTPAQRDALLRKLKPESARTRTQRPIIERHQGRTFYPASSGQAGLWFWQKLHPMSPVYTGSTALRLRGVLDPDALQQSFADVVGRHEVLRTTFEQHDGSVVQRVHPAVPGMSVVDVTSLPASARHDAARAIISEQASRFDLSAGPLFRAALIRLDADDHVLAFSAHHIVVDGWSREILARELSEFYSARVERRRPSVPTLPIQFGDYAEWQQRQTATEDAERDLSYWRDHLNGMSPALLPGDRPRSDAPLVGAAVRRTLPAELTASLRAFTRDTRSTVFITMLAALNACLFKSTGQSDLAVGSPIANRTRAELEPLIGLMANLVILRTQVSPAISFRELTSRVRQVVLDAYEHQDAPFERIVEAVGPDRRAWNPLVQITFGVQESSLEALALPGIVVSPFHYDEHARFDIELHVWESGPDLQLVVAYNASVFDASTVRSFVEGYVNILTAALAEPDRHLDTLSLMSSREREQVVANWNDTARLYPDVSVPALFEARVNEQPNMVAVEFRQQQLTYEQLNTYANRLAHALRRQGVTHDSIVGVSLDRGIDLIASLLGILKAGAAYVALDPTDPAARVTTLLDEANVRVVVSSNGRTFAGRAVVDIASVRSEPATNPCVPVHADALAYVAFTSGSTGQPKGVAVPHRGIVRLLFGTEFARLGPAETHLQLAPVSFDASTFEIWGALLHGGRLVVYPDRLPEPDKLSSVIRERGVTTLWLTSSLYNTIIDRDPAALSGVRQLLVGGEALSVPHVRRGLSMHPETSFVNGYGPTEGTTFTCCYQIPRQLPTDIRSIPLGPPIANTRVYVLDRDGSPVPPGVPGELYIGGDGLARGYINAPRQTAERFVPDGVSNGAGLRLYRSGDQVRWRSDGTLEFLGRRDTQIKIRGHRIELGEVEATLTAMPDVLAAVATVTGSGDDRGLVAYVVPAPGSSLDAEDVRSALRERLPAYMVPASIVSLLALPLTANGKVDRAALPDPTQAMPRTSSAPRSELENQIAEVWREVLGTDRVGTGDNFFDVGGHSLRLLRVHSKLEQLLARSIPLVDLFQYPTIEGLAAHLAGATAAHAPIQIDRSSAREPIAVIGLAGRFPGAPDVEKFWANLRDGIESVHRFTREELMAAGVPRELVDNPRYVPCRGVLAGADLFDASLFGYTPREAALLDPQQRLLLECAWEALERAGYAPGGSGRWRIGVYAGAGHNGYTIPPTGNLAGADPAHAFEMLLAGATDYVATRVSYKLRLTGPSFTVQTACSTSLVAVHLACQALQAGECDIALAGGASIGVPLAGGYLYEPDGKESPDGHTRAFDATGAGTIAADGVGMVVLKRLSAAVADGDVIHAVIRGSAINNDGADKVGFTAPSVNGQAAVIAAAQAAAQVDPTSISYIEAHGTATALGDPIEVAALRKVFGMGAGPGTCGLGSLKTNFGHLNAAAGVAGLIKTVLALAHRELPPSLHFETPNPHIDLGPFYVPTSARPWTSVDGIPRRAGVSSFGIGGTNAHVIVQEAPPPASTQPGRAWHIVPISARTAEAARQAAGQLAEYLGEHATAPVADVAFTQQIGRAAMMARCVAVGRDAATIATGLAQAAVHVLPSSGERPVVWMFSGHGTQAPEMGRALYESEPAFRAEIDACAEVLRGVLDGDLREVLYPDADRRAAAARRLAEWTWSQVALVAVELASAAMWRAWGVRPTAIIGHSIGEVAAACAAGVLTREGALRVAAMRGQLMEAAPRGGMLAVGLSAGEVASRLTPELWLAGVNGPQQCVISGHESAIEELHARLVAEGHLTHRIAAERAGHSALMAAVSAPLVECAATQSRNAGHVPWFSTVTAAVMSPAEAADAGYWGRQVTATVQWDAAVCAIRKTLSTPAVWLELGPGHTLTHLVRAGMPQGESAFAAIDAPDALESATVALGELWVRGVGIEWETYHAEAGRRRVTLPTYPFQRQRYWIEPSSQRSVTSDDLMLSKSSDVSQWFYTPGWMRTPLDICSDETPFRPLVLVDVLGCGDQVISRLAAAGCAPVRVDASCHFDRRGPAHYELNPLEPAHYARLIADLEADGTAPTHVLQCWDLEWPTADGAGRADEAVPGVSAFLRTLYLTQALDRCSSHSVQLIIATSHAHDATGDEALQPEHAIASGLCRVIGQEHPRIRCRTVDVCIDGRAELTSRAADALAAELRGDSADVSVAYRHGHRLVEQYTPRRLGPVAGRPALLRERGTYLITGGLGRVGLVLAEYLARTVQARLVLIARTEVPTRDQWPALENGADHALVARLRRIEAAGGEVITVAADASNPSQMQQTIELAVRRFGGINGVIHAAGITAGPTFAPLLTLDAEAVERQFAPKVAGALVLSEVLAGKTLDFVVLTSSLSTVLGGLNFAAYAAANSFLDAFASLQTRHTGIPWMSVVWDGWRFDDSEAASGSTAELATTAVEGVEVFARLLHAAPSPRTMISTVDLRRRIDQWVASSPPSEAPRTVLTGPSHANDLETPYVAPRTDTERAMAAIWSELIGAERVGVDDDFFALGGHSLLGTRVMSRVRETFSVDLSLHALFVAPTVAALSARVDQRREEVKPRDSVVSMAQRIQSLAARDQERLLERVRAARREAE